MKEVLNQNLFKLEKEISEQKIKLKILKIKKMKFKDFLKQFKKIKIMKKTI